VQNNQDYGDNDQSMNPSAGAREAWANARTDKAKQPQNDENDDDCPQHEISPFTGSIGSRLIYGSGDSYSNR
jgi:hypothetical protein